MSDLRNKLQKLDPDLQARNISKFLNEEKGVESIYLALNVISKRANFLSSELKKELNQKLEDFAVATDRIEEVMENKEQIEISKFYERLPNPTVVATHEYLNGMLDFEVRDGNFRNNEEED